MKKQLNREKSAMKKQLNEEYTLPVYEDSKIILSQVKANPGYATSIAGSDHFEYLTYVSQANKNFSGSFVRLAKHRINSAVEVLFRDSNKHEVY